MWCGGGIAKICVSFSMVVWCGVEFYIMWHSVVWCCANGGVLSRSVAVWRCGRGVCIGVGWVVVLDGL